MLQAVADPTTADFARVERTGACSIGKDEGLCASDIEERVRLSQPTISHTCQFSRKRGLVEVQKLGLWMRYRRNEMAIREFSRRLKESL
jgi:DNA-binding transcriptional ArsR family regulator